MKRKILSILLALCMVCSLLPVTAFAAETPYDLSVGGVQVTSANLVIDREDVTGITGSATFNPDTNTLTLDNFSCSSDVFGGVINIQDGDITIKLKGNNTLTSTDEDTDGIYTNGNLAICNGEDGVAQGQLTINTVSACIGALLGTLEITDVKVTATSTEKNGLSAKSISLSGVTLSATGGWEPIHTDSVYLMDPETSRPVFDPETSRPVMVYGAINIENSTVEAYCTDTVWGDYAFESAPNISGTFTVTAGNDAASAVKVDAPTAETYTTSKYVKIVPVLPTYTVTFDANGATGTVPTQTAAAAGDTFTLPAATDLAKDGYTFAGWNDGTTTYAAGDTYTMPASAVTFIAQWTQNAPAPQPPVYYPSYDPTPVIPSVDVDIHDDTLSDAAKAVGSAVKSGKADFTPVAGYTKEDVIRMQKDDALKLVVEKKSSYDPAEKSLIDKAAQEKGKAPLVQFLEIDVTLRTMNDVIVAEVDDTIVPLSITVDLNAEMQKAAKEGKTIYVARAHDGKVAFLEGTLNADKTKVTFDSSKFSTYALVALDSQTVTSPQTADAGIFLAVSMSVLSVTGSAVLLKKKED